MDFGYIKGLNGVHKLGVVIEGSKGVGVADGKDILDEAAPFVLKFGECGVPFFLVVAKVGVAGFREDVRVILVTVLVLEGGKYGIAVVGGQRKEGWKVGRSWGRVDSDVEFDVVVFVGIGSFGFCCRVREGGGWLRHGGSCGKVELTGRGVGYRRSGEVVEEGIKRGILFLEEVVGRGAFGELRWDACFELDRSFCETDEAECEVDKELSPGAGSVTDVEEFGGRKDRHRKVGSVHGNVGVRDLVVLVGLGWG
jgi:hypothetical protein